VPPPKTSADFNIGYACPNCRFLSQIPFNAKSPGPFFSQKELDSIEVFKSKTKRGNRISLMFVRCAGNAKFTLLFSHGNAVDLGQMSSFFIGLGTRLKCNLFSYDYSGYGVSDGKPSESNLYHDIDTAFFVLRTRYTHNPEQIVLYGQSIGTVPTIDLAQRHEVAGVILHSPLLSGLRIACPSTNRTWCCDAFAKWVWIIYSLLNFPIKLPHLWETQGQAERLVITHPGENGVK